MDLNWVLKFSEQGLGDVGKRLQSIQSQIDHLGKSNSTSTLSQVEGNLKNLESSFKGLSVGAGIALVSITKLGEELGKFAKDTINDLADKDKLIRVWEHILGGRGEAEQEYTKALAFGQQTSFKNSDMIAATRIGIEQGLAGDKLALFRAEAADLASTKPQAEQGVALSNAMKLLTQINNMDVMMLGGLTRRFQTTGLNTNLLKRNLAKELGVKYNEDLFEKLSDKKVHGDVVQRAVQASIKQQFGMKNVGDIATVESSTISGMLSNLIEGPANLTRSLDQSMDLPNMQKFMEMLHGLNDLITIPTDQKDSNDEAKEVKSAWAKIVDFVLELVTGLGKGIGSFVSSFSESFNAMFDLMGEGASTAEEGGVAFANVMRDLGYVLGRIIGPIVSFLVVTFQKLSIFLSSAYLGLQIFSQELQAMVAHWLDDWNSIFERMSMFFTALGKMIDGIIHLSLSKIKEGASDLGNAFTKDVGVSKDIDKLKQSNIDALINAYAVHHKDATAVVDNMHGEKPPKDLEWKDEDKHHRGGGGVVGQVWTWTPNVDAHKAMENLKKMGLLSGGLFASANNQGRIDSQIGAIHPAQIYSAHSAQQLQLNTQLKSHENLQKAMIQTRNPPPITINIFDARNADEVAQKVNVELTRILGRFTQNPTPGVL